MENFFLYYDLKDVHGAVVADFSEQQRGWEVVRVKEYFLFVKHALNAT